ncbi:tripartite tricarboxylate transporter substrate binding protein [Rhodobacteraceae bacterium F11138]|nr:tripartite tricarboxylate transporter substrate binding protein [Rhodobacteraceae bacterium F11138]
MNILGKIAGLLAMSLTLGSPVLAADWAPPKPLKLQIGFAAGGSTDTMGRIVAEVMKEQTGWNIVAENKTGGGGVAMFTGISQRPADGTVIGMGVNNPVLINLITRGDTLPFDLDSFDYLGTITRAQLGIVAKADAPFDTLDEMIAYSKENQGLPVAFDAPPQKFLMEAINGQADAGFRFVSTKGGAENIKLILGGQVQVGFASGEHLPYLKSGDMKLIASVNDERHSYAPDIPTVMEAGYPVYVSPVFYFATVAGTDPAAREALATALANAMKTERVQEVVRNATRNDVMNLGPQGTRDMMDKGLENIRVLFSD